MLSSMKMHFGHDIKVETTPDKILSSQLKKHGASDYLVNTLLKMFHHYNEHGFIGNPNTLSWILGRKPTNFSSFISNTIQGKL
jgi:hypothetical protein